MPVTRRRTWLAAILIGGFVLRAYRIEWGLPDFIAQDEYLDFCQPAARAIVANDWTPRRFFQPPLYPAAVALAAWVWTAAAGTDAQLAGPHAQDFLATIALAGRFLTVLVATFLAVASYLLGRRLLGDRAGLWAAVFVALNPVQVMESHRISAESLMLLFSVASFHAAVVALQDRRRSALARSFALAALSAAANYNGLFAGIVPLWAALRWPGSTWPARCRLVAVGAGVAAAVLFAALSPALVNWEVLLQDLAEVFYANTLQAQPGHNLGGDNWILSPYVYPLLVGLPFTLNWATYLCAVAGMVLLGASRSPALPLLGISLSPHLLALATAQTVSTHSYHSMLPPLAVAAGAFLDFLHRRSRALYWFTAAVVVAYSAAFTYSQVNRIDGAPQAAIGEAIERLAHAKRTTGITVRSADQPKLVIGYPESGWSKSDPLYPYISPGPTRHLLFLSAQLRSKPEAIDPGAALAEDRKWINSNGVDVFLATRRWESLSARNGFTPREAQFFENLTTGRLAMRDAIREDVGYLTRSWYEWADPMIGMFWTPGVGGYTLYVRSDLVPGLRMQR